MKRDTLSYIHNQRGMPWVKIGMRIEVDGRLGTIKGGNDSGNLDVVFDGEKHKSNVHPCWKTKYLDEHNMPFAIDGQLITAMYS
jgi:hypothetical protein